MFDKKSLFSQILGLHSEAYRLMQSNPNGGKDVWVGYSDGIQEGEWKLLNGNDFNARSPGSLYRWSNSEPNSAQGNEDCAAIGWLWTGRAVSHGRLIDLPCGQGMYGLCEKKIKVCDWSSS